MRLLVLGGGVFVGRAVVDAALARGDDVTTFARGTRPPVAGARQVRGDRTVPDDVARLVAAAPAGGWDAVVDTWAGAPGAVGLSATALADVAGRYGYVSSRAVYAPPLGVGMDETHATRPPAPDAATVENAEYGAVKRAGEVAATAAFGERALLARCALVVGPEEEPARLPVWLRRASRGGTVVAPGDPDQPWRLVDVRDLAAWLLAVVQPGSGVSGAVNVAAPEDHATTRDVLEAVVDVTAADATRASGAPARLDWRSWAELEASGVDRWTELPGWVPRTPETEGLISTDVGRAVASGLRCRPVGETLRDIGARERSGARAATRRQPRGTRDARRRA
ncbi:NAD-dependent epimerase/dehydratase family protein [Luteimicrobium sp. NPDC057192]|uniref:NAD-dependent epimerase/dehydratase family protein n=1 Tax=Luteimicrobium sp. NPDC057192 TaxID=3346042 RepID=UPI00362C1421